MGTLSQITNYNNITPTYTKSQPLKYNLFSFFVYVFAVIFTSYRFFPVIIFRVFSYFIPLFERVPETQTEDYSFFIFFAEETVSPMRKSPQNKKTT
jgi:hypothetical protein